MSSLFGIHAKPIQIKVNDIELTLAPTKLLYTIKSGGTNSLTIDTYGCEINIQSISPGVIPKLLDKNSIDTRTLYFGISKVVVNSK